MTMVQLPEEIVYERSLLNAWNFGSFLVLETTLQKFRRSK